jgi:flavin-binding protein dodecin
VIARSGRAHVGRHVGAGRGRWRTGHICKEISMSDSVYKVIELVGTSEDSWEKAAKNAVEIAGKSLKNLRVAEIKELDMKVEDGKVMAYRARVSLSFKYES